MLTKIYSFDPEMILHSHFHFKSFPEKEREKERERERERERRESPDRRERGRRDFAGDRAPVGQLHRTYRRSRCSSISPPISSLVNRTARSRRSISLSIWSLDLASDLASARSHLHRAISSSPPPHDLNLTGFDEFFCWILFLL